MDSTFKNNDMTLHMDTSVPTQSVKETVGVVDPANILGQVDLAPMSYIEYSSFPILLNTLEIPVAGFRSVFTDGLESFLAANTELANKYKFFRWETEYTFEIVSHWQQTGIIGAAWQPFSTTLERQHTIYNNDVGIRRRIWLTPEHRRVIARVGETKAIKLTIPWTSEKAMFERPLLALVDSAYVYPFWTTRRPNVTLANLTPLRCTASTKQTYTIKVWRKYVNIKVGGFIGDLVTPTTVTDSTSSFG